MLSLISNSEYEEKQHEKRLESQRKYRVSHREQIRKREKESLRYISKKVDPKLKHAHCSERNKKMWANPESRAKLMFDRQNRNSNTFKKISNSVKELWKDPEFKANQISKHQSQCQETSEVVKKSWQNPEHRANHLKGINNPIVIRNLSESSRRQWRQGKKRCQNESQAHLNLKQIIGSFLSTKGFNVEYEHPLSNDKRFYIIDVYGKNDNVEVLVEVGMCTSEKQAYLMNNFEHFYHFPYGSDLTKLSEVLA